MRTEPSLKSHKIKLLCTKIQTYSSLGIRNILRVAVYRLGLRMGLHPVQRIKRVINGRCFFRETFESETNLLPSSSWQDEILYFGWHKVNLMGDLPDWYLNPFTGKKIEEENKPWWKIPDFGLSVGDVKVIWEISRFDWVMIFAQRIKSGDRSYLSTLNTWLSDWCIKNSAYQGLNWKCGQEASIRVIHLAIAAKILAQNIDTEKDLLCLVEAHLARILPTLSYAVAQDNNHCISEAVALYIGGSWLSANGFKRGRKWAKIGRNCLEKGVNRLVDKDGSFSQYSVNYHRLMMDALCIAEIWRRYKGGKEFSQSFYERTRAASFWLFTMVDSCSGFAPNIGANDGAYLLPLTNSDIRDFRPSVQLAMALFKGERAYDEDGLWNRLLDWLNVGIPEKKAPCIGSMVFEDGGYAVLRRKNIKAIIRYPKFKFRPSQADALHVDLWLEGKNVLRDAGSFSYNTDPEWLAYFPGTASHNTIQFDDRDQMPRIGRFLFGDWLSSEVCQPLIENKEETMFGAVYFDGKGARHKRLISLRDNRLVVLDDVAGFVDKAILRWRLMPGDWSFDGICLSDGENFLSVTSSVPFCRLKITNGWDSYYYLKKEPINVLEAEINEPGIITTEFRWIL